MNKESGLDVSRIDYTARDTAVILGRGIHFSWKYISIKLCSDCIIILMQKVFS